MRVFLGGTCNNSTWRDELTPKLLVDWFNPVVDDWTEECYQEELKQREECDICLYTITPEMLGVYSIAEVVDDSNKRPVKTIICYLREANGKRFDDSQWKSLNKVASMVIDNGGRAFADLNVLARYLNSKR